MTAALAHTISSVFIALIALTWGGNCACRWLLKLSGLTTARMGSTRGKQSKTFPKAGGLIGGLERLIVAAGVIYGSWEIMAAVVALKSVARFKDLDQKLEAEYFLVGSLFSLAWAGLITKLWMAYDHAFGLGIGARLAG